MAAHAIMLALAGVPGIYFHSLFGSRGWPEGARLSGIKRSINRQKLERGALEGELSGAGSRRRRVFERFSRLLQARRACAAFHPQGGQRVLSCGEAVFGLLRASPDGKERAACLHNLSGLPQTVVLGRADLAGLEPGVAVDLLEGGEKGPIPGEPFLMTPYQIQWWVWK
jgi:sucrose phosphorylase